MLIILASVVAGSMLRINLVGNVTIFARKPGAIDLQCNKHCVFLKNVFHSLSPPQ